MKKLLLLLFLFPFFSVAKTQVDTNKISHYTEFQFNFLSLNSDSFFSHSGHSEFDLFLASGMKFNLYFGKSKGFGYSSSRTSFFGWHKCPNQIRFSFFYDWKNEKGKNDISNFEISKIRNLNVGIGYERDLFMHFMLISFKTDLKFYNDTYQNEFTGQLTGKGLGIEPALCFRKPVRERFSISFECFYGFRWLENNSIYSYSPQQFGIRAFAGIILK
ncbi:MAG: hypothetical protein ACOZCO_15055 [Bacteroidota bacterium]